MTTSFYSTYKIKGDPYLRLDSDRVVFAYDRATFANDRGESEGRSDFWEDDTGYIRVDAKAPLGRNLKCTPGKSIPCGNACVPAMRGGKKVKCSANKAKETSLGSRQSYAEAAREKKGLESKLSVAEKRLKTIKPIGSEQTAKPAGNKAKSPVAKSNPQTVQPSKTKTKAKAKVTKTSSPKPSESKKLKESSSVATKKVAKTVFDSPETAMKSGELIQGKGINEGARHRVLSDPPPKEFGGEIINPKVQNELGISWVGSSRVAALPGFAKDWDGTSDNQKAEILGDETFLSHISRATGSSDLGRKYEQAVTQVVNDLYDRTSDAVKNKIAESLAKNSDTLPDKRGANPAYDRIKDDINSRIKKINAQ